jgi:hypothetical protein
VEKGNFKFGLLQWLLLLFLSTGISGAHDYFAFGGRQNRIETAAPVSVRKAVVNLWHANQSQKTPHADRTESAIAIRHLSEKLTQRINVIFSSESSTSDNSLISLSHFLCAGNLRPRCLPAVFVFLS